MDAKRARERVPRRLRRLAMDFAMLVCKAITFGLHSVIGITDPCYGIMRGLTDDSLPCPIVAIFPVMKRWCSALRHAWWSFHTSGSSHICESSTTAWCCTWPLRTICVHHSRTAIEHPNNYPRNCILCGRWVTAWHSAREAKGLDDTSFQRRTTRLTPLVISVRLRPCEEYWSDFPSLHRVKQDCCCFLH